MSWKNLIFLLLAIAAIHLVVIYGCMVSSRQDIPGDRAALEKIFDRLFASGNDENIHLPEEKSPARKPKSKPWIYGESPAAPAALEKKAAGAKSVILVDLDSRKVLFERNSQTAIPIASLTKLMSLLVIHDQMNSNPMLKGDMLIELSSSARNVENAKLRAGKYIFRELMYSMIVGSYNDAATQLAITCSGSVPAFVNDMNSKARAMGLSNAKFNSPSGLPQNGVNSFASAAEVALLCEAVANEPALRQICSTPRYTLTKGSKRRGGNTIGSDNRMINGMNVPGAFGFKTGFTNAAGRCLAFGIRRNGRTVIGVVTGFSSRNALFDFSAELAEWAFRNTKEKK